MPKFSTHWGTSWRTFLIQVALLCLLLAPILFYERLQSRSLEGGR